MPEILIHNKKFELYISHSKIETAVERVAKEISRDLSEKTPLFICLLNGSFMFASDLLKNIEFNCNISFTKFSSYVDDQSTGNVKQIIGLNEPVKGRIVVIVDDILDTGNTLFQFIEQLKLLNPADIKVAVLFFKPDACKQNIKIDYKGMDIENKFIIGYGLDYNGLGRNYRDVYKLSD